MNKNNKNRPIIIVGCERSGTTMLRLILCSHKNIAIPPQTKYIKKLYKRRLKFGNLSKPKNRQKLQDWFYNNHDKRTKLIDLEIDKNDIQNKLKIAGKSFGAFLSAILKLYSQKEGKQRWGDKHPYYIKYLLQLFKLFPDAQVIHIIRDGRDAVASLKKMPWWKDNSIYAMLNWQEAIRKGIKARKKYSSDRYMEIHYEEIIENPSESVKRVCEFLNEDYSDALLDFNQIADKAIPAYKMDWHSAAKKKINSLSVGRWENDLDEWEIAVINKKLKNELYAYNYNILQDTINIPLNKYSKYIFTKIKYRYFQYGNLIIDKIISIFYRWDLDYRN